ncbi:hypothetical protein NEMIN01_1011 [Nematocida minor]|uniref:uncharacterized protein n=1 Tax=Nematocida minor TaxID=1912983 RepID=UPI00221FC4EC|nr:uncharacterized protein NEMIN01_1011 [Nematocida minor]KAI5190387.1 hypothetical protein NEMIN01_1011 [Nematocida minor]
MAINVTPFIFLLDICSGFAMSFLFIAYSAHERINKHPTSRLQIVDSINISLTVVLNSLFLMWSTGCLLGSYFGVYKIFMSPMGQTFQNLLTLEMIIDIVQKSMCFLVLSLASFQMAILGDHEILVPWGSTCAFIALFQGLAMWVMLTIFKGLSGWVILYVFSGMVSLSIFIFSILTSILINRNKVSGKNKIAGYLPNQAVSWNVRLCHIILASSVLDLLSKSIFVILEIGIISMNQLLIDTLLLARAVSSMATVVAVYTARIPRDKSYSERALN